MNVYGIIVLATLVAFFCWATWAGWSRSAWFASFQGAYFVFVCAGYGLGFFGRTIWDLAKLLMGRA